MVGETSFLHVASKQMIIDDTQTFSDLNTSDAFTTLPVVMFSGTSNPKDIDGCYRDGASTIEQKPLVLKTLRELMQSLTNYSCRLNTLYFR